jgi:hypothetical protein
MDRSENIAELATALAKAQGEFTNASKDSKATISGAKANYTYKFADLANVFESCRQALSSNGLAITQPPEFENGRLTLNTILTHSSGEWMASSMTIEMHEPDIKKMGSAITYLRRYALMSAIGVVADEDDDGHNAPELGKKRQQPEPQGRYEEARELPSSRQQINDTSRPAKALESREQRAGHDVEKIKLKFDRIGSKGLDIRNWPKIVEDEVSGANEDITAYRYELHLDPKPATNPFEVTNHFVKWSVEKGFEDPNPPDADGKKKKLGIGKLSEHCRQVYIADGWRDVTRKELKQYIAKKLKEARQIADNEAHGEAPSPEEGSQEQQGQAEEKAKLVPAGEPENEDWAPGRE